MGKYYLTPGEYEAQQDKQNKNLKVGMWNAEREDKETETLREQAYRDMMQSRRTRPRGSAGWRNSAGRRPVRGSAFCSPRSRVAHPRPSCPRSWVRGSVPS